MKLELSDNIGTDCGNRVVFVSRSLKIPPKMTVVSLMNRLVADGMDVTVITNAKNVHDDYRYDYRIKRLSLDLPLKGVNTRTDILATLAAGLPKSVFVLTDCETHGMRGDVNTILTHPLCCDVGHKIILWEYFSFLSLLRTRKIEHYSRMLSAERDADAVVSNFCSDYLLHKNDGIASAVNIPYLYPFAASELMPAPLGTDTVLLVQNYPTPYLEREIFSQLAETVKSRPALKIEIVYSLNRKPLSVQSREEYLALAEEFGLAERVSFCAPGEKFRDIAARCSLALIPGYHLSANAAFLQLFGRKIPTLFVLEYPSVEGDNGIGFVNVREEGVLAERCALLLSEDGGRAEAEKISQALSSDSLDSIAKKWHKLIDAVAAGGELPEYPLSPQAQSADSTAMLLHILTLMIKFSELKSSNASQVFDEDDEAAVSGIGRVKGVFSAVRRGLSALASLPKRVYKGLRKRLRYRELKRAKKYTYIQMSPEDVRRSQLLALKMLREFERICKKHGLRYYVAAGSLLGAARHKGQIPWDDDVDVTMPRKDYDKFIKLSASELSDEMMLPRNSYPYCFHRIQMKGTNIERSIHQPKGKHGVFLDILPLDGAAPTDKLKARHAKLNSRLIAVMYESAKPMPVFKLNKKHFRFWLRRLLCKAVRPRRLLRAVWMKNARKYDVDKAAEWVCLPGSYGYDSECFPKEYWGEPALLEYEKRMCPVMREWEAYLKLHYGDYMQAPIELEKRTHLLFGIDFGKFTDVPIEELEREVSNA